LSTAKYLEVDNDLIPNGRIGLFPGIEADQQFVLGPSHPDIDHCFVHNDDPASIPLDTRSLPLNKLASFSHPETAIHLEVLSTEPAFQFYTGKFIDVPEIEGAPARGPRSGFAVEPSRYINAVNEDAWRGMVVLKRGQQYGSKIVYRAWCDRK
jgi:aldose 1-epimerase